MCGIAGIVGSEGRSTISESIRRMTEALRHRGPDDEGYLLAHTRFGAILKAGGKDTPAAVFGGPLPYAPSVDIRSHRETVPYDIALGHRRLSIIDLSPAGHQPLSNREGTLWIVYNGEIYNYLELRGELESRGYSFFSNSDTEVLLTAWQHWGVEALRRLTGMFAFAILDLRKRQIFLARDFFGIKPLYYARWQGGFAFASEIKALLRLSSVHRQVDPQRLFDYLRFGLTDHGESTLFSSVRRLPAGHCLFLPLEEGRRPKVVRYWEPTVSDRSDLSFEEATQEVREAFLQNVRLHLRSDVPVGSALSGGIDSSSIVSAMRRVKQADLDLHAFSFISTDPVESEERWADMVGRESGATLHKVRLAPGTLQKVLPDLVYMQDEPFPTTSIVAQHEVFRAASEAGIPVLLDGQGADEVLGGYPRLVRMKALYLLRKGHVAAGLRMLRGARQVHAASFGRLWRSSFRSVLAPFSSRAASLSGGNGTAPPCLSMAWFKDREVSFRSPGEERRGGFREALHSALTTTVLPALLRYEDRNSMSFSVESRVPFLTPSFVEYLYRLPDDHILSKDGLTKAVFRSAMRGITPDPILDRKDKVAFRTPEAGWLLQTRGWCDEVLCSDAARSISALNHREVLGSWHAMADGRKPFSSTPWRWISLILWAEKFSVSFS